MLLLALAACGHHLVWRKHGATKDEFRVDHYECERDARFTYREARETSTDTDLDFMRECMETRGWQLVDKGLEGPKGMPMW